MAGMGAFTRKRNFTPTGPEVFMRSMAQLLGQQNKSFQQVGESVNDYGESRASGKLADLMGTKKFDELSPEEAQIAAMKATGGREMDEGGNSMLKTLMSTKQNELNNANKMQAATTLFGRQNSQIAQKNTNAKDLLDYQNGGVKPGAAITSEQFTKNRLAIESYRDIEKDKDKTPFQRKEAKRRRIEMEFEQNQDVAKTKMDSKTKNGMSFNMSTPGSNTTKLAKLPKGFDFTMQGTTNTEKETMKKAYNDDRVREVPTEYYGAKDQEVIDGTKEKGDKKFSDDLLVDYNGKWVRKNKTQVLKYLNN